MTSVPKLIVLYPPPSDVATFERRYRAEHVPMVMEKIPGLKKFVAARVVGSPAGPLRISASPSCTSTRWTRCRVRSRHRAVRQTVAHAMEISTGGPPVVLIGEDD